MLVVARVCGHLSVTFNDTRRWVTMVEEVNPVDAVILVFRAELRRWWRSWLALALLAAVVGGVVLAATAAGSRTASAFPRFVATHAQEASILQYLKEFGLH